MDDVGSGSLREADVRALVHLLGEVAGMAEPIPTRKRRLMEGLCELVDADKWIWVLTSFGSQREPDIAAMQLLYGGFTERDVADYYEAAYDTEHLVPDQLRVMALTAFGKPFTRRRQQLVPDDQLYNDAHIEVYRKPLDIDQSVYSCHPIARDLWSGIGLHRRWGRPAFTVEQARIVHIVCSEINWLHHADLPAAEPRERAHALTPRLRSILGLLVEGQSRRQIAQHLGLSEYTVRDYMSQVYRHFGVNSQVELIQRFTLGDGGDSDGGGA